MKFGLAVPYNQAGNTGQWAKEAEAKGWDGLFVGDAIWCEDPMVTLAAAAAVTARICLGTMIIPVPLRRPWKIASESVALDRLSNGRSILGIGSGAAWMGWRAFPDEVTEPKTRIEMLEETIEILTLMYQRKPFDFTGKHYRLKLTTLDEIYYPPKPIQQPRIPLWTPAIWPNKKSIQRALKCDGMIVEKRNTDGKAAKVTPADIRELKAYIESNRTHSTPFDIVVDGKSYTLDPDERREQMLALKQAGVSWWVEGLWDESPQSTTDAIQIGPPDLY